MKYKNKIESMINSLLYAEIILTFIIGIYFLYEKNYILSIAWFAAAVIFIILPQYSVSFLIGKHCNRLEDNIKQSAEAIKSLDYDKLKEIEDFDSICESVKYLKEKFTFIQKNEQMLRDILIIVSRNLELESFLNEGLPKIMDITNSNGIAFYLVNNSTNKLEIKSSIGLSKSIYSQFDISLGEGFIGQAVNKNKVEVIENLPDDTIFIAKTFIGKIKPRNLMIVPINDIKEKENVIAVMALSSIYKYNKLQLENIEKIRKYLSYAVINGIYYNRNKRLNNELRFQNQLIQNLNEDLEERIQEKTLFLNNVINSIEDIAIISVDTGNNIIMFNKGAEKLLKINKSEAMGKNIKLIVNGDRDAEKGLKKIINEAIYKGRLNEVHDIPKARGGFYSINVEMFALYNNVGENNGVTMVMREVNN